MLKNFFKKIENKVENLEGRDKFSLLVGMTAFLIMLQFSDFSGFKASISSTGATATGTIQEEITENNTGTTTEEQITEEIVKEMISNEITTETGSINEIQNNTGIILTENPVLVENTSSTGEIIENSTGNIVEITENNTGTTTEDFIEINNKNEELLEQLESEEENKIEVVSDIQINTITNQEDEIESEINEENTESNTSELDEQIEAAIQNIQEIEIQQKAEELAQQIIQEKLNTGLDESEFTISGAETESYNQMVKEKKEQELIDSYEKQIKEKEEQIEEFSDRIEMLENKINDLQKTPEEQEQISLREQAKREAEQKRKELEAEKAEIIKIENIEKEKRNKSLEIFLKDTDGDGLSDHVEKIIETDEKLIDTDGDGYGDKTEIEKFFSPNSEGRLFSDIDPKNSKSSTIISGVKKGLVFLRTGDKFLEKEEIYRSEAIKIIVSAMFESEIYREDEFFEGIELHEDISESDDFAKYLKIAKKHNILDGVVADQFDPYGTFTKAEFIAILVNAAGKSESNKKIKWIDTEFDNWFTGHFSKAKELKIIKTETYNRIFPLDNISRYNAVKYALRASKYSK